MPFLNLKPLARQLENFALESALGVHYVDFLVLVLVETNVLLLESIVGSVATHAKAKINTILIETLNHFKINPTAMNDYI